MIQSIPQILQSTSNNCGMKLTKKSVKKNTINFTIPTSCQLIFFIILLKSSITPNNSLYYINLSIRTFIK